MFHLNAQIIEDPSDQQVPVTMTRILFAAHDSDANSQRVLNEVLQAAIEPGGLSDPIVEDETV